MKLIQNEASANDSLHMSVFFFENYLLLIKSHLYCLFIGLPTPGLKFHLQLVTVMLVGGSFYGVPKILQEAKSAILPVPEKAANSQVLGTGCGTPLNH